MYLLFAIACLHLTQLAAQPQSTPAPADELAEADARLLKETGIGSDGPALLAFLARQTPTEAQLRDAEKLVRQLGNDSYEEREQATERLIVLGRAAVPLLRQAASDPDPEIRSRAARCLHEIEKGPGAGAVAAVLRSLARLEPPGAVAALLRYAPAADDESLSDELRVALAAAAESDDVRVLTQALDDARPARRAAAAYALGRSRDAARRGAARRILADTDPRVRLHAAEGLLLGGDREGGPTLIALLESAPEDVTVAALNLLETLGGEEGPVPAAGDFRPEARRKLHDAWSGWWEKHGANVNLARLREQPPFQNLTLVARVDANKVLEIDRFGKVRREVAVDGGPIEAQMLSGGRLLVVENRANRVTERDLQGKVLWSVDLPDAGLSCQRLPGGSTFIATNSTLAEYTRAGKPVHLLRPTAKQGGRINSALRLRNGHIAVIQSGKQTVDELDPTTGEVLHTRPLPGPAECYGMEEIRNGHLLLACYGGGKVFELDHEGKVVWQYDCNGAFHATRLPNGNTLVTSYTQGSVQEVSPDHRVIREYKAGGPVWRAHAR